MFDESSKIVQAIKQLEKQNKVVLDKDHKYKEGIYWSSIQDEYDITKKIFEDKITFVRDKYKKRIIMRDVEQAFVLSKYGYNKPALIIAGGVIEELLRLYLLSKNISLEDNKFAYYIECCAKNGLLEKAIKHQTSVVRLFRNLIHLENEESEKHTISVAAAKGALASIFTIVNDF